ncbi:hypothetical protein [Pseudomonas putida]
MKYDLPMPEVRLLDASRKNLSLADVGDQSLETYITYPGIAVGDIYYPNWRGCAADNTPFDKTMEQTPVFELDDQNRVLLQIENDLLKPLGGGWVFFSYYLEENGGLGEQSQRLFFYVDKEADRTGLPVPQLQQSHRLTVDLETLAGQDGQLVALPYQAMGVGDKVTFSYRAFFEDYPDDPFVEWSFTADIDGVEKVGKAVLVNLPNSQLQSAIGLVGHLSYSITYQGIAQPTLSPAQLLIVIEKPQGAPDLYPAPTIVGLVGDTLDPDLFPDGIVVEIPPYEGMQAGDGLALYIEPSNGSPESFAALLDASSADSGRLRFTIAHEWLRLKRNQQLTFTYQFGGAGYDGRSQGLKLTVQAKLDLPGPSIKGAIVDPSYPDVWKINGWSLINGAEVYLPEDLDLPPGPPQFVMHWDGFKPYSTSTSGDGKRYVIPISEVPANFGKAVEVYYTVTIDGGQPYKSLSTLLMIDDPEIGRFPWIQTPGFPTKFVSLASALEGLPMTLGFWRFMSVGQLVSISVWGYVGDENKLFVVRDKQPVTDLEMSDEEVSEVFAVSDLKMLNLNQEFEINVAVSFDEGGTFKDFRGVTKTVTQ